MPDRTQRNKDMMRTSFTSRTRTVAVGTLLTGGLALATMGALPNTGWATVDEPGGSSVDRLVADESVISTVLPQVRDLVIRHEASGSVSATSSLIVASPADGTLVSVVEPGRLIRAGDVLATVDDHPVTVIEGSTPMWRAISDGDEGTDVEQLELALTALGFNTDGNVTVDETYTSATSTMVSAWQAAVGAVETGAVGRYDIVVLDGPMMVRTAEVGVGAQLREGDALLGLDSTEQIVTASIPVAEAVTLSVGDAVDLELPDRSKLTGAIRTLTLGSNAAVRNAEIEIVDDSAGLAESSTTARFLQGVTVEVAWDEIVAANVLTVPADTFRHLDDGSYILDVLSDEGLVIALVVEPGKQVGNLVEVAGLPHDAEVRQP